MTFRLAAEQNEAASTAVRQRGGLKGGDSDIYCRPEPFGPQLSTGSFRPYPKEEIPK